MSLEPDHILQRLAGNNRDSKVAQLVVMNDVVPTPAQRSEVMHHFRLHMANVRASAAGYLVRNGELADKSRYRIMTNSGLSVIMLWPVAPGGSSSRLPHGFAVMTNWHAPFIYKFKPADSSWSIASDTLPQLPAGTEVYGYNQIVRLDKPLVLPGIHDKKVLKLWDFGPHKAPKQPDTQSYSVPANLQFPNAQGKPALMPTHTRYLWDYSVVDAGGTVLYAMAPPAAVLNPPESITPLPGCTDATGVTAALQLVRKALTSDVYDNWTYRFCNEALTRAGSKTYAVTARHEVDLVLPITDNSAVDDQTVINNMNLTLPVQLFVVKYLWDGTVSVEDEDAQGNVVPGSQQQGAYGCVRDDTNMTPTITDVSYQRTYHKTAGPTRLIDNAVALPAQSSVEYAHLQFDLTYPESMYLRGGNETWSANYTPAAGERGYSRETYKSRRIDVDHTINASPDVRLDLGWTTEHLYQGTVDAKLYGIYHEDDETDYKRGGDLVWYTYFYPGPCPDNPPGMTPSEYKQVWEGLSPNYHDDWMNEWNGWPVPTPDAATGSVSSKVNVNVTDNTALYLTGDYDLTSRHIIDYDHRSRFMAAIRVEVQCSGARWDQDPAGFQGQLKKTTDPTYTVNIYFESNWNGTTASQLLATGTCTRPAFEFQTRYVENVYLYPDNNPATDTITYWMPPELSLPKEAAESLVNTAMHQGVNPNLVARMYYDPPLPDGIVSSAGIEYTSVTDDGQGNVTAELQKRFVDGQLYARTFKLSDTGVSDALWMLHPLCIDCPQNNAYPTDGTEPVMWYYLPALGDTIANTKFHVEVRNGVIEQWSDNIPHDRSASSTPVPTSRTIALYEI